MKPRIRYEFKSIDVLGGGEVIRVPINCWRLTVTVGGPRERMLVDGQSIGQPLSAGPAFTQVATSFQLGGLPYHPEYGWINLDQIMTFSPNPTGFGTGASCFLVFEYVEP